MMTAEQYVGQPIRSLQTMLRTIAHADETLIRLVPDGIYGPNTVQAVREFQRQQELPVTGETDNATWDQIVAVYTRKSPAVLPAAPVRIRWTPNQVLPAGSRNSHLFLMQAMLQALGRFFVNAPAVRATGVHDAASVAAVRWLQKLSGLPQTGAIDQTTWAYLSGLEAVETIRRCPEIDLILMDIMMPDLDGYDACSRLRACSTAPVLFLTAKTQENDKRRAYDAGGDDYLAKPFSHAELMMKVESLLRRYRVYKNKSSGRMLRPGIVLDEENRRVLLDGAPLELTETEFSILQCLAQNRGRVVPVRTIYETVWHETYMPASNNTVMVHIVNLRKKLEEDPANPRLIRTVWGKGYQID